MTIVTGLAHVGLHVRDMQATIAWYRDKLDFESFMQFPTPDLRVPLLEEAGAQIVLIRRGDLVVELIAVPDHQPHPMRWRSHVKAVGFGGFGHLCLEVDDCFAAQKELAQRDVKMALGPTAWPQLGFTTAHFHDNEGNDLEILSFHR